METEHTSPLRSRRDMLVGTLRYTALSALVGTAAVMAAKRRRLVRAGVCIGEGTCRDCAVLAQCGLGDALAARASKEKGGHGRTK